MIIRYHDVEKGNDLRDIDCPIEEMYDYLKTLRQVDTIELSGNSNFVLDFISILPADDVIMVFL
ncbi:MAG: hypothetical protein PHW90_03470, partial [Bacilli bacterium]|nr:hypothetical protein [Bacilli bacterium]